MVAEKTKPAKALSKPIEDYGLIGNMMSAALVGTDGSIDWLCLPRFDSPACFAAILGAPDHGRWLISPREKVVKSSQRYVPGTAVLETRLETETGAVTITDFMPLSDNEEQVDLVRIVRGDHGEVAMSMELVLRFNYGEVLPWVMRRDYGLSAVAGPDAVELHTPAKLEGRDLKTFADFTLREGETMPFTLSYHPSHKQPHFVPDRHESLQQTVNWWSEWVGRCTFSTRRPRWHEAVTRSLITLKLLTFQPTGGIVAAPTTSLPEAIGGSRNWDYRFCWLRDSALTLYALVNSGYRAEAEAWRQWVRRATAGHPKQLQIMYGISGERWLPEMEVPWLPGYEDSAPVRVGNAAADQVQLDIYGEIAETLYITRQAGLGPMDKHYEFQTLVLEYLESIWQSTDHGIWEMRGPPRAFTHSRMMCWVAFDRAIKIAEKFGIRAPLDHWKKVRDEIHADVCTNGFDAERNTFTQYYGGKTLDASLLLLPQVGFLPLDDPRIAGTIKAIEEDLLSDGFVMRNAPDHVDDGVGGEEGAFLACSFWLADAYVLTGRHDDAVDLFERLLSLRNHLGLLAEEYDPIRKRLVGNFPQALSHLGLINTAHNLASPRHPAAQRAGQEDVPDHDK
ncbi:glycoside hydrolase family 15 protein [Bauldia litoralis]|uniref:glycoside hydrolase family 15 protein n=1 Tax=Bauldia litoralis TaxID=665467 RepID=UPI0032971AE0